MNIANQQMRMCRFKSLYRSFVQRLSKELELHMVKSWQHLELAQMQKLQLFHCIQHSSRIRRIVTVQRKSQSAQVRQEGKHVHALAVVGVVEKRDLKTANAGKGRAGSREIEAIQALS